MLLKVKTLEKEDYERIGSELDVYIDVLKKAFY
jgi:hypothetical protein